MPGIDGKRLIADLRELSQIGRYKTGVHRPTYSDPDMTSRRWLAERMKSAGLEPSIDGIGNVLGRQPDSSAPRMLLGSHTETQPYGGWLDGSLGVIYGLEIARAIAEDRDDFSSMRVDVGAWADEEGHYGSMLGSHSFCGELTEEILDSSKNRVDGTPLRVALARAGLEGLPRQTVTSDRYLGYMEAHIEQGDYLDSSGKQIGVVSGIVGIYTYKIAAVGEQNHAGTTRMAIRKDAGRALLDVCRRIHEVFPGVVSPRSVWTIGSMSFEPGSASVIPGRAEMLFQFRDVDVNKLAELESVLSSIVDEVRQASPCEIEVSPVGRSEPRLMSSEFQDHLAKAARSIVPDGYEIMPSAAGHDAQVFAKHMPVGMLFVPSIGGISHHHDEDTKEDDIILGCEVFYQAVRSILSNAAC